tara:strand:+ start:1798 stop:2091 length:294 start_codon:yes stop_codon:yes gene_type:complete
MNETLHKPLAPASHTRSGCCCNRFFEGCKRPWKDIGVPQTASTVGKTELCMRRRQRHVMSSLEKTMSSTNRYQAASNHDDHGDSSMARASTGQLGKQ